MSEKMPVEIADLAKKIASGSNVEAGFALEAVRDLMSTWEEFKKPYFQDAFQAKWFISLQIARLDGFWHTKYSERDIAVLTQVDRVLHGFASLVSSRPTTTRFAKAFDRYVPCIASMRPLPRDDDFLPYILFEECSFREVMHHGGIYERLNAFTPPYSYPNWTTKAFRHQLSFIFRELEKRTIDRLEAEAIALGVTQEVLRFCLSGDHKGNPVGAFDFLLGLKSRWEVEVRSRGHRRDGIDPVRQSAVWNIFSRWDKLYGGSRNGVHVAKGVHFELVTLQNFCRFLTTIECTSEFGAAFRGLEFRFPTNRNRIAIARAIREWSVPRKLRPTAVRILQRYAAS